VERVPRRAWTTVALVLALALPGSAFSMEIGVGEGADRQTPSRTAPSADSRVLRDLGRMDPGAAYGAFVHLTAGGFAERHALLAAHGLDITGAYESVGVVFAQGDVRGFSGLLEDPRIVRLEANRTLRFFGDTAGWATRARVAQSTVSGGPYRTPGGAVLDGTGVGVAVVDSGIDARHPDLESRVARNFEVVCAAPRVLTVQPEMCPAPYQVVEAEHTDLAGGHGTHVAGIVAGDGTASNGTYKGIAPGATLFGFGTGETITVLSATETYDYILRNFESFTPRIRVINNSWGGGAGGAFAAGSVLSGLIRQLVDRGVTVVFAAGNAGGNGSADQTSPESKNPTPGVISVANYNDANTGTRAGSLNSGSSRGRTGQHNTYPDISAPGTSITSTCSKTMAVCAVGPTSSNAEPPTTVWQPHYDNLSGTSMAAPHVAGTAALLYQAVPGITPAQVEDMMQDTALKFTAGASYEADPENPGGTTSVDKGAGLLNVPALLDALGVSRTGAPDRYSTHTIAVDPPADQAVPGGSDVLRLSVLERPEGLGYTVAVRDAADAGAGGLSLLRLFQNVNGTHFRTTIEVRPAGVQAAAFNATNNSAVATNVTRDLDADTISFTLPFSGANSIGNVPAGSPVHNVRMLGYSGAGVLLALDAAPGGSVESADARPEFGASFTVIRSEGGVTPSPTPSATASPTESPTPTASPTLTPTPTTSPTSPTSTPTPPTPTPGGRGTYPATPNDPYFGVASTGPNDVRPNQWAPRKIQAPQAWQLPRATGFGIKVAVLDTGTDLQHEDLQCPGKLQVVPGSDFVNDGNSVDDGNGHGTHVSGIIGACTNNGKGIAGVAPDVTILPFQVLDANGDGDLNNAAAAVTAATSAGAHVINMSLGSILGPASGIRNPVRALTLMDAAIADARSKGVVVVAAAGNNSGPICEYPAAVEGVLCVGATDPRDLKSWYSSFPNRQDASGPAGAVVAPGGTEPVFCDLHSESILSLYPRERDACNEAPRLDGYRDLNGTSMASPHVAGVAALVYDRVGGVRNSVNAQKVLAAIVGNTDDLGAPGYDPLFGSGRVNALKAAGAVTPPIEPTPTPSPTPSPSASPTPTPTPDPAGTEVSFTDATSESAQYTDQAYLEAVLTDEAGDAIAGAELSFELTGATAGRSFTVVTDERGIAGEAFTVTESPGPYSVSVRYAGRDGVYEGSADLTSFLVQHEDTATVLEASGYGRNRALRARLADLDTPDAPVRGAVVEFSVGDQVIGTATTDEAGAAEFKPGAPYDKGAHVFTATFHGDTYYLGSSDEAATGEGSTSLAFTAESAASGQHSDQARFAVRLEDEAGDPVEEAAIEFELSGPGGSRTFGATTGAEGVAARTVRLDEAPGDYTITARYAGETGRFVGSSTAQAFELRRDDSDVVLALVGKHNKQTLSATLSDTDAASGLAGRTLEFFSDGVSIGSAVTDGSGTAVLEVSKRHDGKGRTYRVEFTGDSYYGPSADARSS
jgi:serine protease AprX